METLAKQSTTTTIDDRLAEISFPSEVIEEILSRLPVKSILRFRSVSNPWRSLISNPSFTKLQFARAAVLRRTAIFISAYDTFTPRLYFLSAAHDGGPVTHLITLDHIYPTRDEFTVVEHLNGLVCFTSNTQFVNIKYSLILNPSTRKIFRLPDPRNYTSGNVRSSYLFFGFDESRNEHKILNIMLLFFPAIEIKIFSMSNYSWRKIDAKLPDIGEYQIGPSVCINSIIHVLLVYSDEVLILAFDLRTDKFSTINTPGDILPHEFTTTYTLNGSPVLKFNNPRMIKITGCIGVVCHDRVVERNEMHIWILQDYENRVWVRETITFPESWNELGHPYPLDFINMDEIIFSPRKLSRNVINVPIYNMKSRCFKSVQFTLSHRFLWSENTRFEQIRCYVESMVLI